MTRSVVFFAVLLAALVAADFALAGSEGRTRGEKNLVRRLLPADRRDPKLIHAIRLTPPGKETVVYVRSGELWRCPSYRNAVVHEQTVESLLQKLFNGEGVVQSVDPARAKEYGFDPSATVRVSIHGVGALATPTLLGDEFGSFEVGSSAPHIRGCYLRVTGSPEILSFDADAREEVAPPPAGTMPPLLDRTLITAAWLSQRKGIKSIRMEPQGAPPFELEGRRREVTPEEMRAGKSPWEWYVKREGQPELLAEQKLAMSYATFLYMAPCMDLTEASKAMALGFDPPRARLTLIPNEGEPLALSVAQRDFGTPPNTAVALLNPFSGSVYALAPQLAPLFIPRAEMLLPGALGNPWEPFTRQR